MVYVCVIRLRTTHAYGWRTTHLYVRCVYSRTIANDVLSLLTFTQCIIIIIKAKLAVSVLSFTVAIFFSLLLLYSSLSSSVWECITMCGEKFLCSSPELSEKFPFNHFLARHGNYFRAYIVHTHTCCVKCACLRLYSHSMSVSVRHIVCDLWVCCVLCLQKRRTLPI